jgi:hypothetical protein
LDVIGSLGFAGKTIRFSAHEFGLVTGLRFGKARIKPDTGRCRLRDVYMRGQNLMLKDFYDILHGMDLTLVPDEDVVKLALYYVLERFFISRDRRRFISLAWLNIIDDLEQFNLYPWGAVSYGYTIEAMQHAMKGRLDSFKRRKAKDPSHRTERYNLHGCPYAIQVIIICFN